LLVVVAGRQREWVQLLWVKRRACARVTTLPPRRRSSDVSFQKALENRYALQKNIHIHSFTFCKM
jgi:hypothetical protein